MRDRINIPCKKRYKLKAQVEGNVIIYVLGAFIASLILIFGYVAINNFIGVQDDILIINFKQDLSRDIDSLSTQYGSVRKVDFDLPSELDEVCFIVSGRDGNGAGASVGNAEEHSLLSYLSRITPSVKNNVYVFGGGKINNVFHVNKLSLDSPIECKSVRNGVLTLSLEAKGRAGVNIQ